MHSIHWKFSLNYRFLYFLPTITFVQEYFSKDKGVSFVENWSRVVKDIGSFRFKRGENLEIFTDMFPGFPKLDEGYKVKLSKVGDSFLEVATFGDGTTFTTPWKYDEEAPFLGMSQLIKNKYQAKNYKNLEEGKTVISLTNLLLFFQLYPFLC